MLQINEVSNLLYRQGLRQGQRVALAFAPEPDFIIAMFACLKLGLPYIPVNLDYPDDYLQTILNNSKISALLHANLTKGFLSAYNTINIAQPFIESDLQSVDFLDIRHYEEKTFQIGQRLGIVHAQNTS